jgi:hypothetical protein
MPENSKIGDVRSRYPGYDVLAKSSGESWNSQTRRVVTQRLSISPVPHFFDAGEFQTVAAIAARIVPQPASRPPVPVAALIDEKLTRGVSDGYRLATMPRDGDAWRRGLKALEAEARAAYGEEFRRLAEDLQDTLLARMQKGDLNAPEWAGMSAKDFFNRRMAHDIVLAYYAHPSAWSEIGWGGPASPRGYVRLDFNDRDPWEAVEVGSDDDAAVRRINRHVR